MMRHLLSAGAVTALAIALAGPAGAAITIYNAPGAVQPGENVILDGGTMGPTVFGQTNQTHTSVSFGSLTNGVDLAAVSNGQARVEAVGAPLDALRFFLTNGGGFSQVEFDLHKAASNTDTVSVTFFGSFGTATRTFDLGNGNNWFSAETTGGDLITSVTFDTSGSGVDDIRQVRLGPVSTVVPPLAVPEPATWAMLVGGFGILGAASRRKGRTEGLFA